MKKIILILLLIASPAFAGPGNVVQFVGVPSSGGSACETVVDSHADGVSGSIFGNDVNYARAGSWTTSKAYDLCKISVQLMKTGAPTGSISLKIHNDDGFSPGTVKATSITTYDQDDLTTSYQTFYFVFSPATALDTATRYHIAVYSDTLNDASNYFKTEHNSDGTEKTFFYNGATWALGDGAAQIVYEAYE